MKRQLIIVNGFSGSGKDLFCECCEKYLEPRVYTTVKHSSDYPKSILYDMGWNGERTPKIRKLLADMCEFCAENGSSLKALFNFIDSPIFAFEAVFYHERDPKEIQKIVSYYKCSDTVQVTTVLIKRTAAEQVEVDRWGIENYGYDYVIGNNSTLAHLNLAAVLFCQDVIERGD